MNVPAELTGLFFAAQKQALESIPEPVDPISDRLTYAAFPPALKAAMKIAATRNAWCRATWAMQTALIQDALLAGRVTEPELIAGYRLKPPEMALEATQ